MTELLSEGRAPQGGEPSSGRALLSATPRFFLRKRHFPYPVTLQKYKQPHAGAAKPTPGSVRPPLGAHRRQRLSPGRSPLMGDSPSRRAPRRPPGSAQAQCGSEVSGAAAQAPLPRPPLRPSRRHRLPGPPHPPRGSPRTRGDGYKRCAFSRKRRALSGWLALAAASAMPMHRSASSLFDSMAAAAAAAGRGGAARRPMASRAA